MIGWVVVQRPLRPTMVAPFGLFVPMQPREAAPEGLRGRLLIDSREELGSQFTR